MLKISKTVLFIALIAALGGCAVVPEGDAPPEIVKITPQLNSAMTADEAVNFVSTELSVNVLGRRKGQIKVLVRHNTDSAVLTRQVMREMRMFLPVVSVLDGEDVIFDSALQMDKGKKVWHVRLKDNNEKILWYELIIIKDEVKDDRAHK